MVVVGTGVYKDTNEAYPLDKKTLRSVALRSLLAGASKNAETAESTGWAWALSPALKKIHTDEEDLSLAMGHHLEYVNASSPLTTLAMGVVLALEVQKADPETIRSVRTALCAAVDGLGNALTRFVLIPLLAMLGCAMAAKGNMAGVFVLIIGTLLITLCARLALINYGYAKGVRAAESFMKHAEALKHAASVAGVFMLGALTVIVSGALGSVSGVAAYDKVIGFEALMDNVMPGFAGLLSVMIAYQMLVKKNRSPFMAVLVFILIAAVLVLLGFTGDYASFLSLPWIIRG